ncbi:MAG: 2-dehydro-3-deoxygalactonokinase [Burkholderiales bacterium]|nr:2-dehydro-3-deoxygalactonokinase [Burkholderiales bacterium]
MQANPPSSRRHGAIGVDWGTTSLRAYRLDGSGQLQASMSNDQGILRSSPRFAEVCERVITELGGTGFDGPVMLSGMIGSTLGWQEVPYLGLDQPLMELASHLVPVLDAPRGRPCWIVPGYAGFPSSAEPAQGIDVMRGEEVQLLGACLLETTHAGCWYVLPGTHSKWVYVQDGIIRRFTTFMTGELFATLSQHGTLASLMADDAGTSPQTFADGVNAAAQRGLSSALFGCRARVVTGTMPARDARDYLSGLLIGAEWREALALSHPRPSRITILGAPALAQRYRDVGAQLRIEVACLDPDVAYAAALAELAATCPTASQR